MALARRREFGLLRHLGLSRRALMRLLLIEAGLTGGAGALAGLALGLGHDLLMGRGEEDSGGRERPSNLATALEALVAAVFLDKGYEAARDFVLRVLSEELSVVGEHPKLKNPKSLLQELVQRDGGEPPVRPAAPLAAAPPDRACLICRR